MFETLGAMTVVTPPSMINPEKLSFTIINLMENDKNHFAKELNKLFPSDNITVYIYDNPGYQSWLEEAVTKSKYVIMEKDKVPIWIQEMAPEKKTYYVSELRMSQKSFNPV